MIESSTARVPQYAFDALSYVSGMIVTATHWPTSANAALLKSQLKQNVVAIMKKTMTAARRSIGIPTLVDSPTDVRSAELKRRV
jgi:hypothetical protein